MRRAVRLLLILVILAAAVSGGLVAGGTESPSPATAADFRILAVDSSSYPMVDSVVVVPRQLSGRALGSDSFAVHEGATDRPVEATRVATSALDVMMIVDGSVGGLGDFRRAQGALLEVPVHLPDASIGLVRSARSDTVVWPMRADSDAVSVAIRTMQPGGAGDFGTGIASALQSLPATDEQRSRAVVAVTGDPTVDPYKMVAAAMRARAAGVSVYVVSLTDEVPVDLARLASLTGGRSVAVGAQPAVAAIDEILAELRGRYRLQFDVSTVGTEGTDAIEHGQPTEVVGAVGVAPLAATVNANGTSASLRMTLPPHTPSITSTSPESPGAPGTGTPGWLSAAAMLLLVVLAALAIDRMTAWTSLRITPAGWVNGPAGRRSKRRETPVEPDGTPRVDTFA